jgi:hypothetical protein
MRDRNTPSNNSQAPMQVNCTFKDNNIGQIHFNNATGGYSTNNGGTNVNFNAAVSSNTNEQELEQEINQEAFNVTVITGNNNDVEQENEQNAEQDADQDQEVDQDSEANADQEVGRRRRR